MVLNEDQENAVNGKQKDRVREETRAVSGTIKIRARPTPKTAPHSEPPTQRGRSASGKKEPHNPAKKPKKDDDKSAVARLKDARCKHPRKWILLLLCRAL